MLWYIHPINVMQAMENDIVQSSNTAKSFRETFVRFIIQVC